MGGWVGGSPVICTPASPRAHITHPRPSLSRAQGLAMEGEFGAAVIYISELAGTNRRGTFVACLQMTVNIGMILATPHGHAAGEHNVGG